MLGLITSLQQRLENVAYSKPACCLLQQPKIGGEVAVHQDSTFLYTDPPTVVGLWIALEDATKENGCLWTIIGDNNNSPHENAPKESASGTNEYWVRGPFCDAIRLSRLVGMRSLAFSKGRSNFYS